MQGFFCPVALYIGYPKRYNNHVDVTPIEQHGDIFIKRDDLYSIAGVQGGKARTCLALAQGATGLVTAGSRHSPQVNIVAHIARHLGIPCNAHTPQGTLGAELLAAQAAGATIIQHRAGYNNVIIARAREDAAASGYTNIPFGMECSAAVEQTAAQVIDISADIRRVVMPVGSGMSLCGVLQGLRRAGRYLPILGIVVGADPTARLDRYAPASWRQQVTLQAAGVPYHQWVQQTLFEIVLDPIYEAKCIQHLQAGDLFWIIGRRQSI